MILTQKVGITAYGVALPERMILARDIELAQGKVGSGIPQSLGLEQKTVPGVDEDSVTLATDAAAVALKRYPNNKQDIRSLFIGSESHPYAVKPSAAIVKESLGLSESMSSADLQFACKAGTQALQICAAYVASGMQPAALAIGTDTAQSRPGDVLEFAAGAGAAAFVLGKDKILARLIATTSVLTDTPDFWRRPKQDYPEHGGRFSGEPGYFYHVKKATNNLLKELSMEPKDIDWCVFHTPNAKFPETVAKDLGFTPSQLQHSLIVKQIGNTYAAASLLALANVLDKAKERQKILVTSYGSGAGADSFLFETTKLLVSERKKWQGLVADLISKLQPTTYEEYRVNTQH